MKNLVLSVFLATIALFPSFASEDGARKLVTEVKPAFDGSGRLLGSDVIFANGLVLEENRDARAITVKFPGGQRTTLKDVAMVTSDSAIYLFSHNQPSYNKGPVHLEIISREVDDRGTPTGGTVMWLSLRDTHDIRDSVEVRTKVALEGDVLGGAPVFAMADGAYKRNDGVIFRPLIPKDWIVGDKAWVNAVAPRPGRKAGHNDSLEQLQKLEQELHK